MTGKPISACVSEAHHGPSAVMRIAFSLIDGGPPRPAIGHDNAPLFSKTSGAEVYTSLTIMPRVEIRRLGSRAQRKGKDRFCHIIILWRMDPTQNSPNDHSYCPGTPLRVPMSSPPPPPRATPTGPSQSCSPRAQGGRWQQPHSLALTLLPLLYMATRQ